MPSALRNKSPNNHHRIRFNHWTPIHHAAKRGGSADFLIDGIKPTDAQIIDEVLNRWHERKQRFSPSQLQQGIDWLRANDFVSTGKGQRTIQQTTLA